MIHRLIGCCWLGRCTLIILIFVTLIASEVFAAQQNSPALNQSLDSQLPSPPEKPSKNAEFEVNLEEVQEVPRAFEWVTWHMQATNVSMWHPGVGNKSAYSLGANSLNAGVENKQTNDLTFFLGLHLSEDTALYINPEVDQGFGISNTLGIAGYSSGSAYKVGSVAPYGRIPRIFLRHMINLGGDLESIEEGPNQFAIDITHDNLTLSVGKFGVVDIFDTNRFAHDPRADFLNWSILDMGAFDYAADSWGYTYGLAAELTLSNWTFRTGLFDLSSVPNSEILDSSFKQFEWVNEVERRYKVGQQEGSVKLLAYVNKAHMGSYVDAVNFALKGSTNAACPVTSAAADGSVAASTSCVRTYTSQGGLGLNLQHKLSSEAGFFARLSLNQGRKETYDFTDINQSLSEGFLFHGKSWGRGEDTIGVAAVVNALSGDAKSYFAHGGMGVLIGDGWLNYGLEKTSEVFYNCSVMKHLNVGLDFQYTINPGYNRDRGPVFVAGGRVHLDF
jgi:high affinity Mn2+ porin